jgi:hypothetical protein
MWSHNVHDAKHRNVTGDGHMRHTDIFARSPNVDNSSHEHEYEQSDPWGTLSRVRVWPPIRALGFAVATSVTLQLGKFDMIRPEFQRLRSNVAMSHHI